MSNDIVYFTIQKLWEEFKILPFPEELHDDKYALLDLEQIDTFVAGSISSFLTNNGRLEKDKMDVLKNFAQDYGKISSELSESGKIYFDKLKEMADLILK